MAHRHHTPYLQDIALHEALERWWRGLEEAGALAAMPGERVPLWEAAGRVTAAPCGHASPNPITTRPPWTGTL